jgi:glutaredoxin
MQSETRSVEEQQKEHLVKHVVLYHAGCPVSVDVEKQVATALDPSRFSVEIVDLSRERSRIPEAEELGVRTVPVLVINDQPFHVNYGAMLEELKA